MKKILLGILSLIITTYSFGQISDGGIPFSYELPKLKKSPPKVTIEKPDLTFVLKDDIYRDSFKYPPRDAVVVDVDLNMEEHGKWTKLENGDRIWRLEIEIPEAVSLELFYENFYLPTGAKLFLFDPQQTMHIGAFTEINNKPRNRFASDAIDGASTVLEYFEPENVAGQGSMTISGVGYKYRDLRSLGGSQHCEVDVNCSEGESWLNEINATMRIRTKVGSELGWCTATLMNNTDQNCRPFILTALHCGLNTNDSQSSTADYDAYKFYFKFQTPGCDSGNASAAATITGCDLRADSNDDGGASGSDFMLLELQEQIPASYNPFWAGWNSASVSTSGGGVCIHHPAADVKKISTYSNTLQSASWQPPSSQNNHWRVFWIETENGWGVTEGGSSGSGIFDVNHRLVGTLTGGSSFCEGVNPPNGPDDPDLFGKLNRHFTSNPNPSSEKLKVWLDPTGSNTLTLDGSANPCGNVGVAEITAVEVFSIYPNPGNGEFYLDLQNEDLEVDFVNVFDVQGKLIFSTQSRMDPIYLDLGGSSEGVYLVQLILKGNKYFTQKILIEK